MSLAPRLLTAFFTRRSMIGTSFSISEATTTITRASSISLMRIVSPAGAGIAVRPCIFTFAPFSGPSSKRRNRYASSFVMSCGSEMPSFAPLRWMPAAIALTASAQVDLRPAIRGARTRAGSLTSVYSKRPRSQIQPSSISSFSRDVTRTSWPRRCHCVTLQPTEHLEQIVSLCVMSHGRDSKRHTRDVRAPTGQRSMMLPLKIDWSGWSNWLVMNDRTPR